MGKKYPPKNPRISALEGTLRSILTEQCHTVKSMRDVLWRMAAFAETSDPLRGATKGEIAQAIVHVLGSGSCEIRYRIPRRR